MALARERAVVNREVVALDHAAVGGHGVTRSEHDDIAGHEVRGRDVDPFAVAQHACRMRHECLQRLGRALGRVLLREADRCVQHDDAEDRDREVQGSCVVRCLQRVREERQRSRHHEHEREQVDELPQEPQHDRAPLRLREPVGAHVRQACRCVGSRQATGRRAQHLVHAVDGEPGHRPDGDRRHRRVLARAHGDDDDATLVACQGSKVAHPSHRGPGQMLDNPVPYAGLSRTRAPGTRAGAARRSSRTGSRCGHGSPGPAPPSC